MLKFIFASLLIFTSFVQAEKHEIHLDKSVLTWVGKKVGGQHDGTVNFKSGYVEIVDNQLQGGEFVLDMTSIKNNDIESDKYRGQLEDHLKSDDFFNVKGFPEGKFVITRVKQGQIPGAEAVIIGELTIKDITKPVQFNATLSEDETYSGKGTAVIDRSQWEIKYRSKSFFSAAKLGDKLIHDDIDIGLDIRTK